MRSWWCRICVVGLALAWAAPARAAWEPGQVVEHDGPWTLDRGQVRLSLLGRSAVALGERVELSTTLPLDLALYPNLSLKWRIIDGPLALAWKGGIGGGLLPLAGAALLPAPVPLAVGGVGLVAASTQSTGLDLGWSPGALSFVARVGVYRAEAGGVGIGASVGPAAVVASGASATTHSSGISGGGEAALSLGPDNVLFAGTALITHLPFEDRTATLLIADLGWMHAWHHAHLMVGAYSLSDLPEGVMWQDGAPPIGPMVNGFWTWGGHPSPAG